MSKFDAQFYSSVVFTLLAVIAISSVDALLDNFENLLEGALDRDICGAEHIGAGIPWCPMGGMRTDQETCCFDFFSGDPMCCNWWQLNMQTIVIVAGVVGGLLLLACLGACFCCLCGGSSGTRPGVVMVQPNNRVHTIA